MWETVKYFFGAAMEAFGYARKRQDLTNTPEKQANAAAGVDADIKTDATKAVASDDLEEIRKQASE